MKSLKTAVVAMLVAATLATTAGTAYAQCGPWNCQYLYNCYRSYNFFGYWSPWYYIGSFDSDQSHDGWLDKVECYATIA